MSNNNLTIFRIRSSMKDFRWPICFFKKLALGQQNEPVNHHLAVN